MENLKYESPPAEYEILYPKLFQRWPQYYKIGHQLLYENEIDEEGEKGVAYGYNVDEYEYALELDAHNNIVGGSWISFERPDFIWKIEKPKFKGYFKRLKRLYRKSL